MDQKDLLWSAIGLLIMLLPVITLIRNHFKDKLEKEKEKLKSEYDYQTQLNGTLNRLDLTIKELKDTIELIRTEREEDRLKLEFINGRLYSIEDFLREKMNFVPKYVEDRTKPPYD